MAIRMKPSKVERTVTMTIRTSIPVLQRFGTTAWIRIAVGALITTKMEMVSIARTMVERTATTSILRCIRVRASLSGTGSIRIAMEARKRWVKALNPVKVAPVRRPLLRRLAGLAASSCWDSAGLAGGFLCGDVTGRLNPVAHVEPLTIRI